MSDWWNSWRRDESANVLIEFAFILPFWLLLATGFVEIGRALYQTNALEKSVRAGALYAARHSFPLGTATITETENLIKTGNVTGSGGYLVSGWGKSSSSLDVSVQDFTVDDTTIPVVRVAASIPFDPLLLSLPAILGIDAFTMTARHEQAYVGD